MRSKTTRFAGLGLLAAMTLCMAIPASAQPSDATVMRLLKQKTGKKTKSIKFSGRGELKVEFERGVKVKNYYRYYNQVVRTEYKGVTSHYYGGVKYGQRGGKWTFQTMMVGDTHYEGIPNPEWSVIEAMLRKDLQHLLGFYYTEIVELQSLELAKDPKWRWKKPSVVSFEVAARFTRKKGKTLEAVTQRFHTGLSADAFGSPWARAHKGVHKGKPEVLSKTTHTSAELAAMPTLPETYRRQAVQAHVASLPAVELPELADHKALTSHIQTLLMTADGPTIEATLRKLLAPQYFDKRVLAALNVKGQKVIDDAKTRAPIYRQQYCPTPLLSSMGEDGSSWFNKDRQRSTDMRSSMVEGRGRVITQLVIGYVTPEKGADKVAKLPCKVHGEPIQRAAKVQLKAKRGAVVFAKYDGRKWYYMAHLLGVKGRKYQVKYLDGEVRTESPADVLAFDLKPGDAVYARLGSEFSKRWVVGFSGTDAVLEDVTGKRRVKVPLKKLRFQ